MLLCPARAERGAPLAQTGGLPGLPPPEACHICELLSNFSTRAGPPSPTSTLVPCAGHTVGEINSQPLNGQLDELMSQVSGQCADYISTSAVSASRRRLLQNANTARITATIYYDPPQVRAYTGQPGEGGRRGPRMRLP